MFSLNDVIIRFFVVEVTRFRTNHSLFAKLTKKNFAGLIQICTNSWYRYVKPGYV